jgi:hypothetical protein
MDNSGHYLVLTTSWIALLFKLVVALSFGLLEWENIKGSLPDKLQEKLNLQKEEINEEI